MTLPSSREGWDGVRAVVGGFGPAGAAAADNLLFLGATVTALDEQPHDPDRADLLRTLGAEVRLGAGSTAVLPDAVDLLVDTVGGGSLVEQAVARGVPVWSDAELAWRLRDEGAPPWLVAGIPSDSVQHVAEILVAIAGAAGLTAAEATASGRPIVEIVMDPQPADLLAVELDELQLARCVSVRPESAVVLDGGEAALGRAYEGVRVACVYNVADVATQQFVMDAEVEDGARAIGITLDTPSVAMLGLVEDILVDRAFIAERNTSAAELATLGDLGALAQDEMYVQAALAAAALARAHGLSQSAVRDGLRAWADTGAT